MQETRPAGAKPMQEMAMDEPENENIQPAEISPEEQIEILKARIKDLEQQVKDFQESKFSADNISKNPELFHFTQALHRKNDLIAITNGLSHMLKP